MGRTSRHADGWISHRPDDVSLGDVLAGRPVEVTGCGVNEVSHAKGQPDSIESQQLNAARDIDGVLAQCSGPLVEPICRRLPILFAKT